MKQQKVCNICQEECYDGKHSSKAVWHRCAEGCANSQSSSHAAEKITIQAPLESQGQNVKQAVTLTPSQLIVCQVTH